MQRIIKWLGIGLAGVLMLIVAAAAYVYAASEYALHRSYDMPLTVFAAPTNAAAIFFRLMRTGRGLGDRNLGLMSEVAEVRFTLFTDEEVRAVRNYLLQRMQNTETLAAAGR